ncbi:MAG TPA: hypothetical protein VHM02_01050, partial [Thermoanaerobaculia bacterium]|nr:hypothetical protein [Thermoanaerobaculia bacterium]
ALRSEHYHEGPSGPGEAFVRTTASRRNGGKTFGGGGAIALAAALAWMAASAPAEAQQPASPPPSPPPAETPAAPAAAAPLGNANDGDCAFCDGASKSVLALNCLTAGELCADSPKGLCAFWGCLCAAAAECSNDPSSPRSCEKQCAACASGNPSVLCDEDALVSGPVSIVWKDTQEDRSLTDLVLGYRSDGTKVTVDARDLEWQLGESLRVSSGVPYVVPLSYWELEFVVFDPTKSDVGLRFESSGGLGEERWKECGFEGRSEMGKPVTITIWGNERWDIGLPSGTCSNGLIQTGEVHPQPPPPPPYSLTPAHVDLAVGDQGLAQLSIAEIDGTRVTFQLSGVSPLLAGSEATLDLSLPGAVITAGRAAEPARGATVTGVALGDDQSVRLTFAPTENGWWTYFDVVLAAAKTVDGSATLTWPELPPTTAKLTLTKND